MAITMDAGATCWQGPPPVQRLDLGLEGRGISDSARREALLAAAEQVFLEKGYVATTMADIAQAAGMSKKTIYQVFASKKEFFDALMLERLAILQMPTEDQGQPPDAVLRSALLDMGRTVLSPRHIALLRLVLANIANAPEVGEVMKKRCVQVETSIQNWLALQVSKGVFSIPDMGSAAAMLFSLAFGEFHWHLLLELRERPPEEALVARIDWAVGVFMREFGR